MKEKSSFNWFYLVIIVILAITIFPLLDLNPTKTINEEGFFKYMKAGKVENIIIYNDVDEVDVFLTQDAKKEKVKPKDNSTISAFQQMQKATAVNFAQLLDLVAKAVPEMRIRFSTSNPQDMSLEVFRMMAKHDNICKYVHLPVQSGSNAMLEAMNRQHTREEYLDLIKRAKEIVPDISFSQDMIIGFCTETEEDHQQTLSLMREVEYDYGYMFSYSERPGTPAHKKLEDDISAEVKQRRLSEVIDLQRELSRQRMEGYVGRVHQILIEGVSRKNDKQWKGRNSQNAVCVFDMAEGQKLGDLVDVFVYDNTQGTLIGRVVE